MRAMESSEPPPSLDSPPGLRGRARLEDIDPPIKEGFVGGFLTAVWKSCKQMFEHSVQQCIRVITVSCRATAECTTTCSRASAPLAAFARYCCVNQHYSVLL